MEGDELRRLLGVPPTADVAETVPLPPIDSVTAAAARLEIASLQPRHLA